MTTEQTGPADPRDPETWARPTKAASDPWMDGIYVLLRAARRGSELAKDRRDQLVVLALIQTAMIAQRREI